MLKPTYLALVLLAAIALSPIALIVYVFLCQKERSLRFQTESSAHLSFSAATAINRVDLRKTQWR